MTDEQFQEIIDRCQPQKVFNLNWNTYYPLDFANTFLPKVEGYISKALYLFDGAALFNKFSTQVQEKDELSKNATLITYTYPKGVEASDKKNRVQLARNEIGTFIEVSKNNDIEVFFKIGSNFKREIGSLANRAFKTNLSEFQKYFSSGFSYSTMMQFILKTLDMEDNFKQDIIDQQKGTNIVRVNEEGTTLMQIRHELTHVGESIAQVKYNTSATVTSRGTVIVTQFKQEIASREKDVWYFKNALGTFEGTIKEAQEAFPDVDFSDVKVPTKFQRKSNEFGSIVIWSASKPLEWETINEYDAEKNNGKPTDWKKWADATQTALDIIGLIPAVGEVADCLNGIISLARGDYADAALSFAAMIPFVGAAATGAKQVRKTKKNTEGVYDLIVKDTDEIYGYVGQSKNVFKRISDHFKPKKGKLKQTILEKPPTIYKMPGSTKLEREIYEQFVILEKYGGDISKKGNDLGYLLNKVNPVGGRFDLNSNTGKKLFERKAIEIAKKYNLPIQFNPSNF